MKLTVLGSGTVLPNGARNSAGYFVELPDARVMMDCGAGTVHALARYGLPWEQMTHLFVSHFHVDHVGELAALFYALRYGIKKDRTHPFTIVGPRGLDRVMDALKLAFGPRLFDTKFPLILRMMSPGDRIRLGKNSTLSVMTTPHTPESLAVRIESDGRALCYSGDTAYDEKLALFFSGAEILISECSFREPNPAAGHLSVGEAARIASLAGVARLIVTHFYFDVNEAELKEELGRVYTGMVTVGRDGLTVGTSSSSWLSPEVSDD
jgi:ribonuclease BN (tRNA processing enzyme)